MVTVQQKDIEPNHDEENVDNKNLEKGRWCMGENLVEI